MTEMDEAYMRIGKYAPKPEPEEEPDDALFIFGYIAGCTLALIFWVWFIIWFMGH